MKLLFDENLSYRLVRLVNDLFPGSEQVKRLGLLGKDEQNIWVYARQHGYCIVTQDDDYAELSILRAAPPHVVLLRQGNLLRPKSRRCCGCSGKPLRKRSARIRSFIV